MLPMRFERWEMVLVSTLTFCAGVFITTILANDTIKEQQSTISQLHVYKDIHEDFRRTSNIENWCKRMDALKLLLEEDD